MASKERKSIPQQKQVFTAVENSPVLLDLLEIATSPERKIIFIDTLVEALPSAFYRTGNRSYEDLFLLFTAWFGRYADSKTIFSNIYAAIRHRQQFFMENRYNKRIFVKEIGLDWTEDIKSDFFSTKVTSIYDLIMKTSHLS
jgi:hypothetical protein